MKIVVPHLPDEGFYRLQNIGATPPSPSSPSTSTAYGHRTEPWGKSRLLESQGSTQLRDKIELKVFFCRCDSRIGLAILWPEILHCGLNIYKYVCIHSKMLGSLLVLSSNKSGKSILTGRLRTDSPLIPGVFQRHWLVQSLNES